jgi:hypothetical protein
VHAIPHLFDLQKQHVTSEDYLQQKSLRQQIANTPKEVVKGEA